MTTVDTLNPDGSMVIAFALSDELLGAAKPSRIIAPARQSQAFTRLFPGVARPCGRRSGKA
jgi:hypothetical protein